MCIAIPMQIIQRQDMYARCEGRGLQRHVNLALVGDVSEGSWVLVHLDTAREVIAKDRVDEINRALDAVELAMEGGYEASMFDDLLNRKPVLPDFLQTANRQDNTGEKQK